jgi:hypothetical protein
MKSLYQAYQAYERRVVRGELSTHRFTGVSDQSAFHEPILAQFGDLLIRTGLKLKHRYASGKPMAWTPMTWSKP